MKLDYVSLLSPAPFFVRNVGSIKSPTLLEISEIKYPIYQMYLNTLLLDIDSYYEMIEKTDGEYLNNFTSKEKNKIIMAKNEYMNLDDESKENFSIYNIMVFDRHLINSVLCSLRFFFLEEITYDAERKIFILFDGKTDDNNNKLPTGFIHEKNYDEIVDIILQRVNISKKNNENNKLKVKNKIAQKLLEKMEKGAKKTKKTEDKKMELGNLISSISSHSKTLNIVNIWDLTIFQLYDQFTRIRYDDSYSMNSNTVSVWGDKENKFDNTMWFSVINKE